MPQTSLTSVIAGLPEPLGTEYELKELLGTGAYALVYKVQSRRTGEEFAVKVVEKAPLAARALMPQLQREVTHLRMHVNTPNVVQLCEVVDATNAIFLRFQLCEKSLEKQIEDDGAMEEEEALQWFQQALVGVCALHAAGTVHRDLKLSNMLVDSEGVLRICDFGWACREDEELTGKSGTPQYAPPEMLDMNGPPHTTKVDVYSLGACLQHLLLGRIPESPDDLPASVSPETMELISDLMQKDPDARPSVEEVLERPGLRPGPFAQLWQQGQEFLAQFGWRQGGAIASASRVHSRAMKIMSESPSSTPPVAEPSHCAQAAYWNRMARPSLPSQLPTPCRFSVPPQRNMNFPSSRFNQGFCVNLGPTPASNAGNTSGYMFRR